MRKNWKYDSLIHLQRGPKVIVFLVAFLISSCDNRSEHKLIVNKNVNNLDGLVQPVNQTVFSSIKTTVPFKRSISPMIFATGLISYNPQLINNISSRFSGRIEKLYLRFNFQLIKKGQRILDLYSPDILTEQQNLIYLLNNPGNQNELIQASKQKLNFLGLTEAQIKQIEITKKSFNPIPIFSPYTGHIHDVGISNENAPTTMSSGMNSKSLSSTQQVQIENLPVSQTSELSIKEGMYVQNGQPIFAVYDISQVWVILNIFQKDAAYVKSGDHVTLISETSPDKHFDATINYIEPVIGINNSAIRARVCLDDNRYHGLKIGTLFSAEINATAVNGMWVTRTAMVNRGKMHVVFVKNENHFTAKEILTGLETDSLVQIISGLNGNEQIAENAQYLVDSESFIKATDNEK